MDKRLLELAVDLVQSQASTSKMTGEELESALIRVYNALHEMQRAEAEGRSVVVGGDWGENETSRPEAGQKSDPRVSIQEDKVSCLECGSEFRQLTANHLKTHQLTPREYKRKWGFPLKQSLAARSLTKLRSRSAKKRGLPRSSSNISTIKEKKSAQSVPRCQIHKSPRQAAREERVSGDVHAGPNPGSRFGQFSSKGGAVVESACS